MFTEREKQQKQQEQGTRVDEEEFRPAYLVDIDLDMSEYVECFTYFMFCPTLVYRSRYPRRKYVHWKAALKNLIDVCLCMVFTWVLFTRFCIPVYATTIENPGDISTLVSQMINASLPGMMLLMIGFFGFLHCFTMGYFNFFVHCSRPAKNP